MLDLDTRAGLSMVRSLGRTGYRVTASSRDSRASGLATRYAQAVAILPPPEIDFEAYARALLDTLESQRPDTVLASIDSSVEALHRHRARVAQLTAPALAAPEALEIALSKERTLATASELGIPVPRSTLVRDPAELEAAVAELGVPCVVKPTTSWLPSGEGGERVSPLYVRDAAATHTVLGLVQPGASALVQELAVGQRETIKLFRVGGRWLARFGMVVDRCWPPLGGSSVMRRTIDPPEDALQHAERLVAEIDLEGYSEVEFRRDGRGRPLLMEVNARLSQSVEVATRAGFDFPRMQLEWARGGSIPRPSPRPGGLRVGWLAGDLRTLVGAFAGSPPPRPRPGRAVRDLALDYTVGRARIEGFDLHDVGPMTGAVSFALRSLVRRDGA